MKADIHPEYRAVVFQDTSGESWITRSIIETDETIDGKMVRVSSCEGAYLLHKPPIFTGTMTIVTGRVERLKRDTASVNAHRIPKNKYQ